MISVSVAVYYATEVDAIRKGLFNDWYPASQSFTGPGGLFHVARIPGYRTHDLKRAQSIVEEVGGIRVKLATLRTPVAEQVLIALQTQWRAAGMEVAIELYELPVMIRTFQSGDWQAILSAVGSYDPEAGTGAGLRFRSDGAYSGVHDPNLDNLLAEATASFTNSEREAFLRCQAHQ